MNPPDLLPWLGRLHPLVLHVPIGLLVAALLVEGACLVSRGVGLARLRRTLHVVAALAAAVAATTGWWLAEDGGEVDRLVDAHKRLGIAFAATWAVVALVDVLSKGARGATARRLLLLLVLACGTLAGHLGGAVTHGTRWLMRDAPDAAADVLAALDVGAETLAGWLGAEPLGLVERAEARWAAEPATEDGTDDATPPAPEDDGPRTGDGVDGTAPDATPPDATTSDAGAGAAASDGGGAPDDAAADDLAAGLLERGVLGALGAGGDEAVDDPGADGGGAAPDGEADGDGPGATPPPEAAALVVAAELPAVAAAAHAVLAARCIACHGPDKQKGRLRLDTEDGLRSVVPVDDPAGGELWFRVTLPRDDLDAMPPEDEDPLDPGHLDALRAWIEAGAPLAAVAAEVDRERTARAGARRALDALREATGARITPVTDDPAGPLRVDLARSRTPLDEVDLAGWSSWADRVAELSLAGRTLPPGALAALPPLPGLLRLHLERTGATDDDVLPLLAGAPHLAYLNLHGTAVTDAVLDAAEALPGLRRLVLLDTGVTDDALARFAERRPDVRATGALALPPAPEPLTVATAGADGDPADG